MSHPRAEQPVEARAQRLRHRPTAAATLAAAGLLLAGCAGPGSSEPAGPGSSSSSTLAAGEVPTCGSEPVELSAYVESGFPLPKALFDAFTEQNQNVTFDVREDQFAVITQNAPRVLADSPPDLMRLPQMSELAQDGLLKDLDPYAEAFGWDQWPASQLQQLRVGPDGTRGDGPLQALGLNFSMTGVFYNKELAAQIGMTEPPETLEELDTLLAEAEAAGITPIQQFNGGATGGLLFPLQNLMAAYGSPADLNDWIFQKEGADIDTPENLEAVRHLQRWIDAGYFADDVNSVDYATMMSRFIGGDGLLMFDGDWESANLDEQMAGKVGFFLTPPVEAGGPQAAMSAPLTFGIADRAEHADCAAAFLDWVVTDEEARTITVEVGGSHPMGPSDAFMPPTSEGSVTAATLAAGAEVTADDGAMDFLANATGAIYAQSWTPNLQRMVAGEQTPEGLLTAVQEDYASQSGS